MFNAISLPPRRTCKPAAYKGWALDRAVLLDCAQPGFLSASFHASSLKRHAQFAVMAALDPDRPDWLAERLRQVAPDAISPSLDRHAQIARALILGKARALLLHLYGSVPNGLLGAFARLGLEPLPRRESYEVLHHLFAEPQHCARARVLRQIGGQITPTKLDAVEHLDPLLLHPGMVAGIFDQDDVRALNAALRIIRETCSTATDEAIRSSVEIMPSDKGASYFISRWLDRADRFPFATPVPEGLEDLVPLTSGAALTEAADRHKNCLKTKIVGAVLGRYAYVEVLGERSAIIEFQRVSNGWLFDGVYGRKNKPVEREFRKALRKRLEGFGVQFPSFMSDPAVSAVAKIVNLWGWDDTFDDADTLAGVEDATTA